MRAQFLTIRQQTIPMHHQNVLWLEPFKLVVSPFCMAHWAQSKRTAAKCTIKTYFVPLLGASRSWILIDLEFVVSARARCQSNPSSTNFARITQTKTPKLFFSKKKSAALTVCWGAGFPLSLNLAWPPLQSLAMKKNKLYFVQILGGEKLLKLVEKVPVKYF